MTRLHLLAAPAVWEHLGFVTHEQARSLPPWRRDLIHALNEPRDALLAAVGRLGCRAGWHNSTCQGLNPRAAHRVTSMRAARRVDRFGLWLSGLGMRRG